MPSGLNAGLHRWNAVNLVLDHGVCCELTSAPPIGGLVQLVKCLWIRRNGELLWHLAMAIAGESNHWWKILVRLLPAGRPGNRLDRVYPRTERVLELNLFEEIFLFTSVR